jgi:hypothetical protein
LRSCGEHLAGVLPSLTEATKHFHEVAESESIPAADLNVQRIAAFMLAVDAAVRDDTVTNEELALIDPMASLFEVSDDTRDDFLDAL